MGTADNTGCSTGAHLHFGLKPIAQGENDWTWTNSEQTNGYFGAIDPAPYFVGISAYEFISKLETIRRQIDSLWKTLQALMGKR